MRISKLRRTLAVFLSAMLVMMTALSIMPVKASALGVAKKEVTVTELWPSGCLKTMTVLFQASGTYATAYGKIGIQTQETSMHYKNPYISSSGAQSPSDWPDTVTTEGFIAFGDGEEFLWSNGSECMVTVQFQDGDIDLKTTADYYIYLWTRSPSYGIYPDALLRHLKTQNGKLLDESGNAIVDENTHFHSWAEVWTTDDDHHWHECTANGCNITENSAKGSYGAHVYDQEAANETTLKSAGTCTSPSVYYKSCICGKLGTDTFERVSHPLTYVPEKAATCTESGNEEYYKCSSCGKLFSDSAGTIETTLEAVTIPVTEHSIALVPAKDATCTEDGNTVHYKCSVCDKLFLDRTANIETTLEAVTIPGGHSLDLVPGKDATCTEDGNTAHYKCSVCDKLFSDKTAAIQTTIDKVTISATGHAWSDDYTYDTQYHWHECEHTNCPVTKNSDKDGYAAHISSGAATEDNDEHCTVCGYVINPALDHVCSNNVPTFVPEVPANCTTDGVKAHYVCRCGKLFLDKTALIETTTEKLVIAKTGHTEVIDPSVAPTCTETGLTEGKHCSVCKEVIVAQEVVPALGHTFEDGKCIICDEPDPDYVPEPEPEPEPEPDPDEGDIIVDSEDNVGEATVDGEEVKEAIEITPEEQELIDKGETLHIILNVKNADDTVSPEDKELTQSALKDDMTIGMFLDISLIKKIGSLETAVINTKEPITITFAMPEALINTDENAVREFFIVRVHDGKAELLKCTFDAATGMASFMTDKFSSYAIGYADYDVIDELTDAEEAAERVKKALEDYDADNDTTEDDILDTAKDAAGDDVTVLIVDFKKVPATEDSNGSITVIINITDNDGNTETVEKVIIIDKLPSVQPEPEKTIYYDIVTSGNVYADKSAAAAGEVVFVRTVPGYDIIVTAADGRRIAKINEKGSFAMPASKVYVSATQNDAFAYMSNSWRHSYVYSYDADMNKIKVSSDVKRGIIVIDLGAEHAGCEFTIYSGRKNTKTEIVSGTLDKNGRFTFNAEEGKNYTLVVR